MQINAEKLKIIQPYIAGLAIIAFIVVLIFSIYFVGNNKIWIIFLTGILIMAVLAEAANISNTERVVIRRGEQLKDTTNKLSHESKLRKSAEKVIAASKSRLILIDEELPIMVALIDDGGMCQYYNRAFMEWLHLQPQQIIGQNIRSVLGAKIFREVATAIRQSLDGHPVHYERIQKMPDMRDHRLFIEHLPRFNENGEVTGFYMLVTDITSPGNANLSAQLVSDKVQAKHVDNLDLTHNVQTNPNKFVADPFSKQTTENDKNTRGLLSAIENGEYCAFRQLITSIAADSARIEHYEILIRLIGAGNKVMLPKEFFPLAEMNGHMLHLDRWVIEHIVEWTSRQSLLEKNRTNSIFFINVSDDTINDASFSEFLRTTLREHNVPSTALCFEIPAVGLILRNQDIAEFAKQIKKCGCHVAISGFGQDPVLFDLIQGLEIDFLKIDGGIIRNIVHDPVDLTAVRIINRKAKEIGIKTVAESVENKEIIKILNKTGVHFAQGYGIEQPYPLVGKSQRLHSKSKVA